MFATIDNKVSNSKRRRDQRRRAKDRKTLEAEVAGGQVSIQDLKRHVYEEFCTKLEALSIGCPAPVPTTNAGSQNRFRQKKPTKPEAGGHVRLDEVPMLAVPRIEVSGSTRPRRRQISNTRNVTMQQTNIMDTMKAPRRHRHGIPPNSKMPQIDASARKFPEGHTLDQVPKMTARRNDLKEANEQSGPRSQLAQENGGSSETKRRRRGGRRGRGRGKRTVPEVGEDRGSIQKDSARCPDPSRKYSDLCKSRKFNVRQIEHLAPVPMDEATKKFLLQEKQKLQAAGVLATPSKVSGSTKHTRRGRRAKAKLPASQLNDQTSTRNVSGKKKQPALDAGGSTPVPKMSETRRRRERRKRAEMRKKLLLQTNAPVSASKVSMARKRTNRRTREMRQKLKPLVDELAKMLMETLMKQVDLTNDPKKKPTTQDTTKTAGASSPVTSPPKVGNTIRRVMAGLRSRQPKTGLSVDLSRIRAAFQINNRRGEKLFADFSTSSLGKALIERLDRILAHLKVQYHRDLIDTSKHIAKRLGVTQILDFFAVIELVSIEAHHNLERFLQLNTSSLVREIFISDLQKQIRVAKKLTNGRLAYRSDLEGIYHFRKHHISLRVTIEKFFCLLPQELFQKKFFVRSESRGRVLHETYLMDRIFGTLEIDLVTKKRTICTIYPKTS